MGLYRTYGAYDDNWNTAVLGLLFAYCAYVHNSTWFSPFELFFGHKPQVLLHEDIGVGVVQEPTSFASHVEAFLKHCSLIKKHARFNIDHAHTSQKVVHDKSICFTTEFRMGDVVAF